MEKFPFNIAFLTDKLYDKKTYSIDKRDAEGNDPEASYRIKNALESICQDVIMFDDVTEFLSQINNLKNTVVFSTRYGEAASSSKAQVPAICEAKNISFIGADSYTHMLCNDKALSKLYAREFDLLSPNGIIIRDANNREQLNNIHCLKLPIVVKPNYGGGSNGIMESNLKNDYESASSLIKQLYEYQKQPILVEEYIPGHEVEVILFGNCSKIYLCEETQLLIDGNDFFEHLIWGLEKKKIDDSDVFFRHSQLVDEETRKKMQALFQSFNKCEFMRIDCRVNDTNVYVLELSPDCYLGDDGGFYYIFEKFGFSYQEMFYTLIENSLAPQKASFNPLIEKFSNYQ